MLNIDYINLDEHAEVVELPGNGFISIPALLTRTGIFQYQRIDPDGTVHVLRQLRLPEEVFSEETLQSMTGLPFTNNHPPSRTLNPENASDFIVGMASGDPKKVLAPIQGDSEDYLQQQLTIFDDETISLIRNKKKLQISLGYRCQLDMTPGFHNGQPYDCIQRNIQNNHGSLVKAGRAGPNCKVLCDDGSETVINCDGVSVDEDPIINNEELSMKFKIDGKEYEVSDDAHALLTKFQATADSQAVLLAAKQTEVEKVTAQCDSLKSEVKTQEQNDSASEVREAVKARMGLEREVGKILGEDVALDSLSDEEMKSKVIAKVQPDISMDGKSQDYLDAMYDICLTKDVTNTDERDLGRNRVMNRDADNVSSIGGKAQKAAWDRDKNLWKEGAK